jgi:squalene-associated FAD-dependent desaturase
MTQQHSMAVVGAGWSGLSAAVRLAQAGVAVTLFEAAREAGGRARALDWTEAGLAQRIDNGQHIMIGAYRETLALMALVKPAAEDGLRRIPLTLADTRGLHLTAARLVAPLHMLVGLITARGMSLGAKLAMARLMRKAQRGGFRLEHDVTVLEWLRSERQPADLTERLWMPLCVAALNTPARIASAQIFMNVLRDSLGAARAASDLLLPITTLDGALPDPALEYLKRHGARIELGRAVQLVEQDNAAITLATRDGSRTFDAVVLATPAHQVAQLIGRYQGPDWEQLRACCQSITWQPIATCYLVYDRPIVLPEAMLALAEDVSVKRFGQWVFARGQLGGRADTLAVVISASGPHQELAHADLAAAIDQQVRAELHLDAQLLGSRIIIEKRATFAALPNQVRPCAITPSTRLVLAGDYIASDYPATLESAVASGRTAAEQILRVAKGGFA